MVVLGFCGCPSSNIELRGYIYCRGVQAYISPRLRRSSLIGVFWPRANRVRCLWALGVGASLARRELLELNRTSQLAQAPFIKPIARDELPTLAIVLFVVVPPPCGRVAGDAAELMARLRGLTFATWITTSRRGAVAASDAPALHRHDRARHQRRPLWVHFA